MSMGREYVSCSARRGAHRGLEPWLVVCNPCHQASVPRCVQPVHLGGRRRPIRRRRLHVSCFDPGEGWDEVLPFIDTPEKATALYILISTTYHIDVKGRFAELIGKCREVEPKELGVIRDGWPSTTQSKGGASPRRLRTRSDGSTTKTR